MILKENNIEDILERVAPYVSDLDHIRKWILSRSGKSISDIQAEIDKILNEEAGSIEQTDFRILKNLLEKIEDSSGNVP